MARIKVYVHLVWTTKNRLPLLYSRDIRVKVWKHIKQNADEKDIFIDSVNGYAEHCHCLISLSSGQTIEKVVQLIKGESSRWINKEKLINDRFGWQDEYFAVSVSESMIERVRNYIRNQEDHHKKVTFADEYKEFMGKFGFE